MSYSLKNKTIALIAIAFAVMIVPYTGKAAEIAQAKAPSVNVQKPISDDVDIFGLEEDAEDVANDVAQTAADKKDATAPSDAVAAPADAAGDSAENNKPAQSEATADIDDFLNDVDENNKLPVAEEVNQPQNHIDTADTNQVQAQSEAIKAVSKSDKDEEVIPTADAPKSPFENFGNAILSKVDSDLFNQMSNIEKQTTLLNLEIKREELKNRVAALKAARARAQEEENDRRKDIEEKRKEREAERQAKIIAEQEKLKQREIELEKVRQARVLNEYMNEMLMINQQWVEKNSALQARVVELEKERLELIKDFEKKSGDIYREISSVKKRAEASVSAHERVVTSLNAQITQLRRSVIENEDRYKKLKEGNSSNPFAQGLGLDGQAIDMSKEYAIMDITGKGDNIVAKIVNSEGTTFIVHKGSMLKGGEVVVAITDNYIAFENRGVKSYLYTGGSVMEFEPTVSFNDSDKMPEETEKVSIKKDVRNVLGQDELEGLSPQPAASASDKQSTISTKKRIKRKTVSSASGMFSQ